MSQSPGSRLKRGNKPVPSGGCDGFVRRVSGSVTPCVLDLGHKSPWHRDEAALAGHRTVLERVTAARREFNDPQDPDRLKDAIHSIWSGGREPLWKTREREGIR